MLPWFAYLSPAAESSLSAITLRAALAAVFGFATALATGSHLIAWLRRRFREPNASASERLQQLHRHKDQTPTMGGLFIVAAIVAGTLAVADLSNPYVWTTLATVVMLGALGAVDDLAKLRTRQRGISVRAKLVAQSAISLLLAVVLYQLHRGVPGGHDVLLPGVGYAVSLGWWFVPLATLVIVGSSNAVNLTDGLDGLAGGCLLFAAAGIAALTYVAGHADLARYLHVLPIAGAGEAVIPAGAMIGGLLGFLWFNCHPAQVFMGDTGSLSLGGLLGVLALVARQELLLLIVGGVFVVEALSVIVQVGCYKWTRRRVLRCAPLHHHFQFCGWPESRIVVRFWIASALCAVLGVAAMRSGNRMPTVVPSASSAELARAGADRVR